MNNFNILKNKKLLFALWLVFALLSGRNVQAQDSTSHRFTTLKLEVRADFDVITERYHAVYFDHRPELWQDTVHYGLNGKYFNLCLGGEFGKGFSYYFRQRIIANPGASSLFDNTDFLYLQYNFKDHWSVRVGKEALAIGGFEYDAPPIDVFYYTSFWGNVYCFQLAGHLSYTDKDGKNKVLLQVSNSPYLHYAGTGGEWKQGLLGYSLMWYGAFPHFQTIYSVNFFERKRGKFVNYISLGNKLQFGWWSWYVDFQNRAFSLDRHFFDNFSAATRMDFRIKSVNLFVKAGYDQNRADIPSVLDPEVEVLDPMMLPAHGRYFCGLGLEYRPVKCPSVRLHAFVNFSEQIPLCACSWEVGTPVSPCADLEHSQSINGNIGITWNIDFLRYFKHLQEKKQQQQ